MLPFLHIFLMKGGSYSFQHVFARPKVVHDRTTSKTELVAVILNSNAYSVVKFSMNERVKCNWQVTNSQVML